MSWSGQRSPASTADAVGGTSGLRRLGSISCVLPCYNEAENLEQLLPLLSAKLAALAPLWEIVLVDDGSTDTTSARLARWAAQPEVHVLQLSRNFGKEAALTAGLESAKGEVVVIMDSDSQHPLALLDTFVHHWQSGADVVYGVRANRDAESTFKRLGTHWFYGLLSGADRYEVPENAGDFRLMSREVVLALLALPERNRFMKGMYAWVGFESVAVPYEPLSRPHGTSHFTRWRLVRLALDGLTAFTTWPLRAVIVLGFAMALAAFCYGAYLTLSFAVYGHDVSGWTTIVVGLMLFSGVQLVSLGVVGEYVGRVYEEVKRRPLFVVKRELGRGLIDGS